MSNQERIQRINDLLVPSPNFEAILAELNGLQIRMPSIVIPAGELISRARCEMAPFQPMYKAEIAHITNVNAVGIGRANLPGVPAFYGSLFTQDHNKSTFYGLSILEATKLINNPDSSIACEYPVVGYWKTLEPLKTAVLVGDNPMRLLNPQLKKMLGDTSLGFDGSDPGYHALEYFSHEYCNDVKKGEEYKYAHTASLAYILHEDYDAIIYPSTKAEGDGVNIAIRGESTNKIDLLQALTFFHKREGEKEYRVHISGVGKYNKEDGSLKWESVPYSA